MWPDRVSIPGSPTYKSGALPTALHSLAAFQVLAKLLPLLNMRAQLFKALLAEQAHLRGHLFNCFMTL